MGFKLPEWWRCADGRLMSIRQMGNAHIRCAVEAIRRAGYISYAEWRAAQPEFPSVVQGDMLGLYAQPQFDAAFDSWVNKKVSAALDAFEEELAYRQRNNLSVLERPDAQHT